MLLLAIDHFADVGVNGIFVMMQQPITSVPLSFVMMQQPITSVPLS
jgi:hypothetical protein